MAVIATGRLQRGAQKLLGVKGEVLFPDVDSALQPSFDPFTLQIDQRVLYGWRSFCVPLLVPASVGNLSGMQLRNPALVEPQRNQSAGVIAVIERWMLTDTSASNAYVELFRNAGLLAQPVVGINRDARISPNSVTGAACSGGTGNPAATSGTRAAYIQAEYQAAGSILYRPVLGDGDGRDELVLMPGDDWTVFAVPTNDLIRGAIWWRERALDPAEVTA